MKTKEPRPAVEPLALGAADAAAALGISRDHLDSLDSQGKLPSSVRLGARKLWSRSILAAWLDEGCPDRATWERLKTNPKK